MGQSMTKIHARRLNKKMKYKGPETMDLTPGETYQCIGEITEGPQTGFLFIIDESGEDYIYSPEDFEEIK